MPSIPQAIQLGGAVVDVGQRAGVSSTVVGAPAAAAETIICSVTVNSNLIVTTGVFVLGFCSITIGTAGTALRLRIRETNVSGFVCADSQATTGGIAAGNICDVNTQGFDQVLSTGGIYVLTAQVTSATAASTVGAANLMVLVL